MTADAKIGLLLALIFIVAIAFVINGLPVFRKSASQGEPQKDYFSKYKNPEPGLVGSARKVAPALNRTINLRRTAIPPNPRYRTPYVIRQSCLKLIKFSKQPAKSPNP